MGTGRYPGTHGYQGTAHADPCSVQLTILLVQNHEFISPFKINLILLIREIFYMQRQILEVLKSAKSSHTVWSIHTFYCNFIEIGI